MFDDFLSGCLTVIIVLVVIGSIIGGAVVDLGNKQSFDGVITSTQIDDGDMFFVVEKSDGTSSVYENEDSLWYGKFNSSDYIMNLKVGSSYAFMTIGYRVPFLSAYPNIIKYTPLDK
jgi:hypothetical protein